MGDCLKEIQKILENPGETSKGCPSLLDSDRLSIVRSIMNHGMKESACYNLSSSQVKVLKAYAEVAVKIWTECR